MMGNKTYPKIVLLVSVLVALLLVLSCGWLLMARSIQTRTTAAVLAGRSAASRIWGGSIVQESPSITRQDGAGLPIAAIGGKVQITMDYRKRGLVYLTGYMADLEIAYSFRNPGPATAVLFALPFPENGQLFTDVKTSDEQGQPLPSMITPKGVSLACPVPAGGERSIHVAYQIRGMDNFIYRLPKGQSLLSFDLVAGVSTSQLLDYPVSTMAPTGKETLPDGTPALRWKFQNVVTDFDIGLVLPQYPDQAKALVKLNWFAPLMLAGFLALLLIFHFFNEQEVDFMAMILVAIVFFLVFPLASYMTTVWNLQVACIVSLILGGVIILVFLGRFYGARYSLTAGLAGALIFLGFFPLAIMSERYTGLMLTIGAFILVVTVMEVYLSSSSRREGQMTASAEWA